MILSCFFFRNCAFCFVSELPLSLPAVVFTVMERKVICSPLIRFSPPLRDRKNRRKMPTFDFEG
ncbi:hypothetical protein E2C01_073663 [Portunus trituberculatus]|uniref:Uncharacterized protein n=1 Tax=Portunus trituberculatus TaxID=210409 RepID=A0A5B7I3L6_PORTR|nr:hypothetical protein [Portunus trituberculatus]